VGGFFFPHFEIMADLSNPDELNEFLADKSYIEGYTPSQSDVTLFKKIGSSPDKATHPHAARWFKHIASFSAEEYGEWPGEKTAEEDGNYAEDAEAEAEAEAGGEEETTEKPAEKPAQAADDEIDFFADDNDEEAAEKEAEMERRAQEALAKKAASMAAAGKVLIAKSMVTLDVKPLDDTTDLSEIEKHVRQIVMDGLEWKSSKFVPVCYGIQKLQIQCVVIDDKVSVDDITEQIEAFDELVQSVDVAAFNKL